MITQQFETFREIAAYERNNLKQKEPSSFNGWVRIKRYRITVEEIEEPKEVLCERLQKLWDECDNSHQWESLKATAKNLGYELKGSAGNLNNRK